MKYWNKIKGIIDATRDEPFWKFLLMTALLSLVLISMSFNAQPSEIDDNYHYMNLGKALYQGDGYVRLDTYGHPPENIVAPGYPLLIAGIMKLTGNPKPLIAVKIFSLLCFWLSVVIAVVIIVKFLNCSRSTAFFVAILSSISQFIVYYASYTMTEAPFLFFSTLTVYLFLLYLRDDRDVYFYLMAILAVVSIYVRLPGAPLTVAIFLWLVLRKKYLKAVIFALIVGAAIGGWVIPKIVSGDFQYAVQVQVKNDISKNIYQTKSYFTRYAFNIGFYAFIVFPRMVLPFLSLFRRNAILFGVGLHEYLTGIPIFIIFIIGAIRGLKDRERAFPYFYALSYFAIICIFLSNGIRYMMEIYPWFLMSVIMGFKFIVGIFGGKPRFRKIISTVFAIVIIALALPNYFMVVNETSVTRRIARKGIKPPHALVVTNRYANCAELHRLYHACEWIRQNLPEEAVIMASQQRTSYYYSERACVTPQYWENIIKREGRLRERELRETEIDSMWEWALDNKMTHVIIDPIYMVTKNYIKPGLARYQDCVHQVYETREPVTRVFEVDTTCLREFLRNNSKAEIDEFLREIVRLKEEGDEDSLESLLDRHDKSDAEVEGICRYLSYYIYLLEFDDLEKLFKAAHTLYPENPILWFNWGIEHNRMQLTEVSIPAFQKALEYGADSGDCYNNLGVAMSINKNAERATEYFEKAMNLSPDDTTYFKNRLAALISTRDLSSADSLLEWATSREDVDSVYSDALTRMKRTYDIWKKRMGLK